MSGTHMVKLKAISKSVDPADEIENTQQLLAFFARVSASANQMNHNTGPKLIRSLITRQEWSPLEMVHLTMEIQTTRDIGRQILRHRSFSYQEFSQRYAAVTDEPVFREARLQDAKDRQNSIPMSDEKVRDGWQEIQGELWERAMHLYQTALEHGIAKEVARVLLPEGMTPTRMYMAGTLRSWYHYCALRTQRGTQLEHRLIAQDCWSIITEQFPDISFQSQE